MRATTEHSIFLGQEWKIVRADRFSYSFFFIANPISTFMEEFVK